jgi:hypothetical protein
MNKEPENLSRNDEKLRGILSSLEKVDAPKDFNFKLKSKITDAKSTRVNSTFWRYFAIAVPSLACVMLIAFFAFNRNVSPMQDTIATVENPQKIEPAAIVNEVKPIQTSNTFVAEDKNSNEPPKPAKNSPLVEPKVVDEKIIAEPKPVDEKIYAKIEKPRNTAVKNERVLSKVPKVKDEFIGQKTSAVTDIPKPILPKGLNGNSPSLKINETDTVFEIENVLKDLGIETTAENGKLKVKSVTKKSLAENSGVKTNDVIDAVDNQKITPKEIRKKAFDAKSINVIRDGKTIELKLQN